MHLGGDLTITSAHLWQGAVGAAILDAALVPLLTRVVSPESFRQLKWYLVAAAALTHAALWAVLGSACFWDSVYRPLFPDSSRWVLPLLFGLLEGLAALAFWWISGKAARWAVACFVLLSGSWSVVTHGIAIGRGLLEVPALEGASVASALVFAFLEYVLYGCVIVGLALAGPALRTASGAGPRHPA